MNPYPYKEEYITEQAVELLVDRAVAASALDPSGNETSPFLIVYRLKNVNLVRMLGGKGGADPDVIEKSEEKGKSCLPIFAVVEKNRTRWLNHKADNGYSADTVEALADLGADLNKKDEDSDHSPLSLACRLQMRKTTEALIYESAALGGGGGTRRLPLIESLLLDDNGSLDLLSLLLESGVDPNEVGLLKGKGFGEGGLMVAPLQALSHRDLSMIYSLPKNQQQ
uniref:Uncharacterized protein n=1 Tax=Chromera velia CCMP2878 TaxID=1169474 RepID=A0A0G4F1Y5_9ALVE|eukprot:Cvel_14580.t1-p1 / transcript=Cvel_14580.t1 / gene=Cvel_14580 / organism=Chromera_velia_CCMP2878 / gene_product=hypothetical protein / transcript_product=hypothetical protein / location=Cvel_scaffold1042:39519-40190(-) / protein_length=224 / sequence_SO=supercontig / SO=protein_coding / is_pseudo=false